MASSVLIWSPMISRGQPQILTDTLAKKHRPPPWCTRPPTGDNAKIARYICRHPGIEWKIECKSPAYPDEGLVRHKCALLEENLMQAKIN